MDFICIILGLLFTVFGIVFAFGKIHKYISAWKRMPDEEKEKINIEPLCRNIGAVIAISGIIFMVNGFCEGFTDTMFTCAIVIWMILAGADVYYISKSKRYMNQ